MPTRSVCLILILTNDSKATVSVLYWYGNYPQLRVFSDFFDLPPGGIAPPAGL